MHLVDTQRSLHMNTRARSFGPLVTRALLMSWSFATLAQQQPENPPTPEPPKVEQERPRAEPSPERARQLQQEIEQRTKEIEERARELELSEDEIERRVEEALARHLDGRHDDVIFNVGDDSFLPKGERATSVVSILGNSTVEGEVSEVVMSILGNTRLTGRAGEAAEFELSHGTLFLRARRNLDVAVSLAGGARKWRRHEAVESGIEDLHQIRSEEDHRLPAAPGTPQAEQEALRGRLSQREAVAGNAQISEVMRSRHGSVCSLFVLDCKLASR